MADLDQSAPVAADAELNLLRDELKALKDEQRDRIKTRDSLIYSVIVAIAAVAGGTRLAGPAVPLLLPPVALLLGWTYLVNDQMISAIGVHLRTTLAPRFEKLVGAEVLLWESGRLNDGRFRQRKLIQLSADLIAFVVPAAAAVVWYWLYGQPSVLLIALSLVEAAATLVAAWQIVAYAEVYWRRTPAGPGRWRRLAGTAGGRLRRQAGRLPRRPR
jgi:hypothetical protein